MIPDNENIDPDVTSGERNASSRDVTQTSRDVDVERKVSPQTKWNSEHPKELYAHQIVRGALKRGIIAKEKCAVDGCDATEVDAHHDDYDRPFHVTWLCRKHHQQWHAERRAAACISTSGEAA